MASKCLLYRDKAPTLETAWFLQQLFNFAVEAQKKTPCLEYMDKCCCEPGQVVIDLKPRSRNILKISGLQPSLILVTFYSSLQLGPLLDLWIEAHFLGDF